tara:strand:- start:1849 stop:2499 length:651 start_codon:yes stop_codon:yes gene_type:complete
MTAKEEDILTSINLIRKGIVLDKVLESIIVDKKIKVDDLLVGDKNGLIIAARILGYGKNYDVTAACSDCGETSTLDVDCTLLKDKELSDDIKENKFSITLPATKVTLEFKLITSGEEKKVEKDVEAMKKIQPDIDYSNSFKFKRMITSIDGDTTQSVINDFVDNKFLAQDSLEFRRYINKISPDVDMTYPFECTHCSHTQEVVVPLGTGFFWPNAS